VRPVTLIIAAAALLASTLTVTAAQQNPSPQPQERPAADPDTGLFVRTCNECHDAARIVSMRRTMADWEDVLKKMIDEGATGTEKDFDTIFAYLNRNYGKVYINRAPADEIVAVLTLSPKEAEAVVAFRKASGAFADFQALKKVPGIDLKKLEEHKDAIAF